MDCAQRAQTSAKASNLNQKVVIRDSNPDFRINPDSDPDVCRIAFEMLWIHDLVGVISPSFMKSVRDCMRNANKCP